jgi:NAD(P)-dependent dehydrogenase (short-subunit alcohol dehydrogenase family)
MKNAIVTGGAHGIGKAIAGKLLDEGCRVIVLDVNEAFLDALTDDCLRTHKPCVTFRCDVGDPVQVEQTMLAIRHRFHRVDYLVNNAGVSIFAPIETLTVEAWNRILATNLSGMFYCTKFAQPFLSRPSAIVNIASTRALMSEPHGEAYGAAKGGVVALTHALAVSLGPGTRVNCISPGWIEVNNDYDSLTAADHAQHPAGTVGHPDDIAETAAFLLGEKARFITGQNFVVDGGMTKKMIYV